MRLKGVAAIAALLASCSGNSPENDRKVADAVRIDDSAEHVMWVLTDRTERRTCPSLSCGEVGRLFHRERVVVLEVRDDWARITEPYSASCVNGQSEYVETGEARCTDANGISNGEFSEWVAISDLTTDQPADPAATATIDEALIAQSDDFATHRGAFVTAANELIAADRCTAADFEEMGGWMKSINHRDEPIYFTYCGGMTTANRIYLDASTGRIFR
jgi:hypothetical protein